MGAIAGAEQSDRPDVPADIVGRHGMVTAAADRTLPVAEAFVGLLPGGLPRGATVAVGGPAGRSCALALVGAATAAGSWVCMIGLEHPGWRAADELGVDLAQVVVVDPTFVVAVPELVATAIDGFDAVLVGQGCHLSPSAARRLAARARERGTVLLCLEEPLTAGRVRSVFAGGVADLVVRAMSDGWSGLGSRRGRLDGRQVHLVAEGRRVPGRRRRASLFLPDADGRPQPVAESTTPASIDPDTASPHGGRRVAS